MLEHCFAVPSPVPLISWVYLLPRLAGPEVLAASNNGVQHAELKLRSNCR